MDNCIVCLTNRGMFSRIYSKSREWQERNIQRVIEKHLWWWYSKVSPPNHLVWICCQCWQELLSFHTFYTRVEKIHQQYELIRGTGVEEKGFTISKEPKINLEQLDANEEVQFFVYDSTTSDESTATDKIVQADKLTIKKHPDNLTNELANGRDRVGFVREYNNLKGNIYHSNEAYNIGNGMKLLVPKEEQHIWVSSSPTLDENFISVEVYNEENENHSEMNSKVIESQITRKIDKYLDQSEYKFNCHLCKMSLKDFPDLKIHFRLEHKSRGYALCCKKKFYNRGQLADHLRVHKDPNYFKCPQCNRILAHRMSFKNHMKYHKLSTRTRFTCGKCEKTFIGKVVYESHLFTHLHDEGHKLKSDYDDISEIDLRGEYLLNCSEKKMHCGEYQQKQICPYCWKVSPNTHAHRQHIAYAHTMQHKYACHLCEKKFRRPLELKEHLSTHTGKPLYKCPQCSRTFNFSANMHKHHKNAHPKEWQETRLKRLKKLATKKLNHESNS